MKKLFAVVLATMVSFSLVACSDSGTEDYKAEWYITPVGDIACTLMDSGSGTSIIDCVWESLAPIGTHTTKNSTELSSVWRTVDGARVRCLKNEASPRYGLSCDWGNATLENGKTKPEWMKNW